MCGVRLCENTSGRIWQIINLLCVRTAKGVLPACSGKDLADRIKVERGEKAIAEAVKTFRKRASELLAEQAGLACDGNDIIATTPRGYQLSPKLTVEVASGATRKNGKVPVPEKSDAEERKEWFLAQLRKGKRLTRRDYEKQFTVSIATANGIWEAFPLSAIRWRWRRWLLPPAINSASPWLRAPTPFTLHEADLFVDTVNKPSYLFRQMKRRKPPWHFRDRRDGGRHPAGRYKLAQAVRRLPQPVQTLQSGPG